MKKRGHGKPTPKFRPTEDQRALVKTLSGMMVNQDQIRLLVLNRHSGKPISKATLHRYFKEQLEVGNIALKELIARKYVEALENNESWAIRLGLKNKNRWSIADSGALPPELLANGDDTPELRISFVMPSKRA